MSAQIQWLGHASFRIASGESVAYIDPWKLSAPSADATVVLVSHSHYDHCSPDDVVKVSTGKTVVLAPPDTADKFPTGQVLAPGGQATVGTTTVTGVPAYNVGKAFHPKANQWLGAVVAVGGVRIYYAGDTDLIPEMGALSDIDLALLPVGGTYTMDAREAAEAVRRIAPRKALPYHWGDIVGSEGDAEAFGRAVRADGACEGLLLHPGESATVD